MAAREWLLHGAHHFDEGGLLLLGLALAGRGGAGRGLLGALGPLRGDLVQDKLLGGLLGLRAGALGAEVNVAGLSLLGGRVGHELGDQRLGGLLDEGVLRLEGDGLQRSGQRRAAMRRRRAPSRAGPRG